VSHQLKPPTAASPWWKSSLTWIKVVAISILAAVLYVSFNRDVHTPGAHGDLPPFELPLLSGGVLKPADLKGKVTILNFFATWCAPCRQEMPDINRFAARQDVTQVQVIAVAAGNEHRLDIRPFVEQFGIAVPVALDGEMLLTHIGGDALPTTVVLDRNGHIAKVAKGVITDRWLEQAIAPLLGPTR